MYLISELTHTS